MPSTTVHIGPMSAIYIGDYGASSVLTYLSIPGTGEQKVTYGMQEAFSYYDGNSLQAGPAQLGANLTFLSDDPSVVRIANGNSLSAAWQDTPSTFNKYVLLLLHPDSTAESSILIPQCYSIKNMQLNYDKSRPTSVSLQFIWQDRNRFNQIYYKRTAAELASILGAISPI